MTLLAKRVEDKIRNNSANINASVNYGEVEERLLQLELHGKIL
jgi:hypothetical protein